MYLKDLEGRTPSKNTKERDLSICENYILKNNASISTWKRMLKRMKKIARKPGRVPPKQSEDKIATFALIKTLV